MRPLVWAGVAAAVIVAAAVVMVAVFAGRSHHATVATCTAEIVAHPRENTVGPGCKGLSQDQLLEATLAAVEQGAHA